MLVVLFSSEISNNYLTSLLDETFHGLSALQSLDLSGNRISLIEEKVFSLLPALTFLDMANNPSPCVLSSTAPPLETCSCADGFIGGDNGQCNCVSLVILCVVSFPLFPFFSSFK